MTLSQTQLKARIRARQLEAARRLERNLNRKLRNVRIRVRLK